MKIISCYIENFGRLHSVRCELESGLNMMDAGNGWGKSTFAAYLRAMFYGLPPGMSGTGYDKKDLRRNYRPWQGGKFGGRLLFEYDSRKLQVERFFGDSPDEDSFSLTDAETKEEITDFESEIGLELFGIDAEGFERSAYIPQNELEFTGNDAIEDRLLGLLENDGSGKNTYRKALERLESAERALDRGDGRGKIPELKKKLSLLEDEIKSDERRLREKEALLKSGNRLKRFLQARLYEDAEKERERLKEVIAKKRGEAEAGREGMKKEEERLRQLEQTVQFLREARAKLSDVYMNRMRTYFAAFLMEVTEETGITLENDFSLKKTAAGEVRSIQSLSCGLRDLVQLCARFALVDTLYEKERPPIILDDVMTNLDDRNFERMMRCVKRLSEKGQVIYLTCHSSREVH
ncbi:MAG: AAA family ATPase [Lachnospiraceae bacterium]|nr:AAA family ATPase [Lachnospiraceae bacterium]